MLKEENWSLKPSTRSTKMAAVKLILMILRESIMPADIQMLFKERKLSKTC